MAAVKFGRESREWYMFQDFWQLCQKYWEIEPDNDKYWEDLVEAVIDFPKKHGNDKFAIALALAFVNTQSDKHKQYKSRKE